MGHGRSRALSARMTRSDGDLPKGTVGLGSGGKARRKPTGWLVERNSGG